MRTLVIILLLGLNMSIFAQVHLGSSATEISNEFSDREYNLENGYTDNNTYYIIFETNRAYVYHFFDNKYIANCAIIFPKSQGALNFYVERYNSQYVIESDKEWKMYSEGGIAYISLIYKGDI